MKAEDIPFLAALVFPGFIAIQTYFWATRGRKMSDVMRVTWSFLYSAPIFFGLHGAYRHLFQLDSGTLASPQMLAQNPGNSPIWFLVTLYLGAAVAGYIAGLTWESGLFDQPLRSIGLDVRRHRDVLTQALRQRAHIDVVLTDGEVIRGWPYLFSSEEDPSRFLYLVNVRQWDVNRWRRDLDDLLVPMEKVRRIYFVDPRKPLRETDGPFQRALSWLMSRIKRVTTRETQEL